MSKSIRASIFVLVILLVHFVASAIDVYPAENGTYISIFIAALSLLNVALTILSARWRKTPSAHE